MVRTKIPLLNISSSNIANDKSWRFEEEEEEKKIRKSQSYLDLDFAKRRKSSISMDNMPENI